MTNAARHGRRLAAGDLAVRMPETGAAEIGTLERSFNSLAASLGRKPGRSASAAGRSSPPCDAVATLVAEGRPSEDVFSAVVRELSEHLPAEEAVLGPIRGGRNRQLPLGWAAGAGPVRRSGAGSAGFDRRRRRVPCVRGPGPLRGWSSFDLASGPIAEQARAARDSVGGRRPGRGRWRSLGGDRGPSSRDDAFPADAESWLAAFTELVGTAIANADARAELAASRARVVTASDEARRRIERNLHDGAQQRLVSLGLRLRTLESTGRDPERDEVRAELRRARRRTDGRHRRAARDLARHLPGVAVSWRPGVGCAHARPAVRRPDPARRPDERQPHGAGPGRRLLRRRARQSRTPPSTRRRARWM